MTIFSQEQMNALAAPHVARAWFLYADLPAGPAYWHNGVGRKSIGGQEYLGVTSPIGGQLVNIASVEDPRFGQAAVTSITLSGANREFFQSVHDTARAIEGRQARLYWAAFNQETEEVIGGLVEMVRGFLTAPSLVWQGIGSRMVSINLVGLWEGQNYQFGGRWTDADQRRRYLGDKGLQYVGVKVAENWE